MSAVAGDRFGGHSSFVGPEDYIIVGRLIKEKNTSLHTKNDYVN